MKLKPLVPVQPKLTPEEWAYVLRLVRSATAKYLSPIHRVALEESMLLAFGSAFMGTEDKCQDPSSKTLMTQPGSARKAD